MENLSHIDNDGKARMVDVSSKNNQLRIASARGHITLAPETLELIRENKVKKGNVLEISEIAGIQAAKQTSTLIPLCHPLQLTNVKVGATTDNTGVTVTSEVRCVGKTGVEMEALTAVGVGLLTIYDMCKSVDKQMIIGNIELVSKEKHEVT